MTKKFYESIDLKGNDVDDVQSLQLVQDATADDHAVRKLQSETIAALAVQAKIVSTAAQSSGDTSFSSDYVKTALATKQPNLEIDSSSTAYLEIVDGYKVKLKDLGILSTHKKPGVTSLAAFISGVTFNNDGTITSGSDVLDAMTFIFMEDAVLPQERSFIYLGTNNGTADDFVSFSVDYNSQEIRSFFSSTGTGLVYDAGTGQYSLDFGNGLSALGAHTMPIDQAEFTTVTGSTVLAILKALEAYTAQVDADAGSGEANLSSRIDNLSGVTGSSMGTFTGNVLSDNLDIKELIQELEDALAASTLDRAAIRSEVVGTNATLQGNIDAEALLRTSGDVTISTNLSSETSSRIAADSALTLGLSSEASSRVSGDDALDLRLDTVEGDATVTGSVLWAKDQAITTAAATASAALTSETNRATTAEAALGLKIDNLQVGDIRYIGNVSTSGVLSLRSEQIAVESPTSRHGLNLKDVYGVAGEMFVCVVDQTLTFDDASTIVLENGDRLMLINDVTAGDMTAADFNVVQSDSSALSVANLDASRIEKTVGGHLDIVADSVTRVQLSAAVEADIDDRQSLTSNNNITTEQDSHFYTSSAVGAQQNVYWKRSQVATGALTGTVRTVLAELMVSTSGSGNPVAPSYANGMTCAAHYQGSCTDFSVVQSGANFESNASASSVIQATGLWARADAEQLGTNIGLTAIADGAASSNVGGVFFSGTTGTGKDRGMIAAVSSNDVLVYSGIRASDPFPYNDICVVADAKYAPTGTKAIYSYGDVKLDTGKVEVADAPSTDLGVMRLADVKNLEKCYSFDLADGVDKVISCTLDLDKCIIQAFHADQDNVELSITRDDSNSELTVRATGQTLTGVRLLVRQLSCAVTSV
jgi:hypothetical protein